MLMHGLIPLVHELIYHWPFINARAVYDICNSSDVTRTTMTFFRSFPKLSQVSIMRFIGMCTVLKTVTNEIGMWPLEMSTDLPTLANYAHWMPPQIRRFEDANVCFIAMRDMNILLEKCRRKDPSSMTKKGHVIDLGSH